MANINDFYGGNNLKAQDLKGQPVQLKIKDVSFQEFEDDGVKRLKPIVHFVGTEKTLVLNKTNGMMIADRLGDETNDWKGHAIVLYPDRVSMRGEIVDAIRVRHPAPGGAAPAPQAPAQAAPAPAPAPFADPFGDDDIPF